MNEDDQEIDPDTFDFDSLAELRGWRSLYANLVELSTPAEGVVLDATALAHAAWCLDPKSNALRRALETMKGALFATRAFRSLPLGEQARVRRLMSDKRE